MFALIVREATPARTASPLEVLRENVPSGRVHIFLPLAAAGANFRAICRKIAVSRARDLVSAQN